MTLFTFQQLNLESGFIPFSSGKSAINSDYTFFRKYYKQISNWFSMLNCLSDSCVSTKNHKSNINKNRLK